MNFIQLKKARKHRLRALFVCIVFIVDTIWSNGNVYSGLH